MIGPENGPTVLLGLPEGNRQYPSRVTGRTLQLTSVTLSGCTLGADNVPQGYGRERRWHSAVD
jgi:hypothetical protein